MEEIIINESEQSLYDMKNNVENAATFFESVASVIQATNESSTLMESAVIESTWEQLKEDYNKPIDFDKELPGIVPYMTPDEHRKVNEDGPQIPSDFGYVLIEDGVKYQLLIKGLQENLSKAEDKKSKLFFEKCLLTLGWNPYVEMCKLTMEYARKKQVKWFNEHKQLKLIDLSHLPAAGYSALTEEAEKSILAPIYIVLSYTGTVFGKIINWWKKSEYSHAALSLDSSLKHLWSYNRTPDGKVNGLSLESIDDYKNKAMNDDANLFVMAVFVPKQVKKKVKDTLEWYRVNQRNTHYSFQNIAMIVFNKTQESLYSMNMVCSQFVDNILKIANVDITHKANNLVSPQDFKYVASKENKAYILFEGLKSQYDPRIIDNKVKSILNSLAPKYKRSAKEIRTSMATPHIEDFCMACTDNIMVNSILEQVCDDIIRPTSVIEVARIPVGFNKKGDLYIDAPKDLEAEYKEAHKLLKLYDESNIQGIKHELARLFWIGSLVERRLKKVKKGTPEHKELIRIKTNVMNDFSTYMKLVNQLDPGFDFSEYMKHTEYYDKTIIIGNDTLKYTGRFIKKAFKMFQ